MTSVSNSTNGATFQDLPAEDLLSHVLSFLAHDLKSLLAMREVSRDFKQAVNIVLRDSFKRFVTLSPPSFQPFLATILSKQEQPLENITNLFLMLHQKTLVPYLRLTQDLSPRGIGKLIDIVQSDHKLPVCGRSDSHHILHDLRNDNHPMFNRVRAHISF